MNVGKSTESTRCLVHAFVLWLDNPAMGKAYDYITQTPLDERGFHYMLIHHKPDVDETKPHVHCMICLPNKRTPVGVRSMFGVDRTMWRLAQMELNTSVKEKFDKCDIDIDHPEGYYRKRIFKDSERWVLKDPAVPDSFIEEPYHDGELYCRVPCGDNQIWRFVVQYRIPHVEAVSDRFSYAMYMLHRTPRCTIDGLKQTYDFDDLIGDQDFIMSCFPVQKSASKVNVLQDVQMLADHCTDFGDLLRTVITSGRDDLVEYIEKHSFLVRSLFPR